MLNQLFICTLLGVMPLFSGNYEERFDRIYSEKMWGTDESGEGFSGGGSLINNAYPFYEYLVEFLREHEIKSVVDLGCGDWTFSKHVDWTGIDYIGYDVVESVIEKNIQKYACDHIHFVKANFLEEELPPADLLICKHVLQHMPNEDVMQFVCILPKYKHCLILNAKPIGNKNIEHTITETFPFWDDRGIDLTLPPFNVTGKHVLQYSQKINSSGVDLVTHIENVETDD